MTVKIDMEMPKSCRECRALVVGKYCVLANPILITPIKDEDWYNRPSWCPLQEVKE